MPVAWLLRGGLMVRGFFGGAEDADRTADILPFDMIYTVQNSGAPLLTLPGTSVLLNLHAPNIRSETSVSPNTNWPPVHIWPAILICSYLAWFQVLRISASKGNVPSLPEKAASVRCTEYDNIKDIGVDVVDYSLCDVWLFDDYFVALNLQIDIRRGWLYQTHLTYPTSQILSKTKMKLKRKQSSPAAEYYRAFMIVFCHFLLLTGSLASYD